MNDVKINTVRAGLEDQKLAVNDCNTGRPAAGTLLFAYTRGVRRVCRASPVGSDAAPIRQAPGQGRLEKRSDHQVCAGLPITGAGSKSAICWHRAALLHTIRPGLVAVLTLE